MVVSVIGGGNHRPVVSRWLALSYNVVSSTPRQERDSNHCIVKYKSTNLIAS